MKKVLVGIIGVLVCAIVVLFVMQESRSSITAPTIKPVSEDQSDLTANAPYYKPAQESGRTVAPQRRVQEAPKAKKSKPAAKAVSAEVRDERPTVPVAKVAALPTLEDRRKGRWIENLSGENVDLKIKRAAAADQDCSKQDCDRTNSYSLVGVVVETRRLNQDKDQLLDGDVAIGDTQEKPLVYVK